MSDKDDDVEEVMYLSVHEINNLLDRLKERDKDIVELLIEQNNTLLDAVVDLQWFMKEQGLTSKQFKAWMEEKDLRTYH
tara:strand:+ start:351 stop:587 length:237 start_codon:yes stop_codon:yes gene_type:complete